MCIRDRLLNVQYVASVGERARPQARCVAPATSRDCYRLFRPARLPGYQHRPHRPLRRRHQRRALLPLQGQGGPAPRGGEGSHRGVRGPGARRGGGERRYPRAAQARDRRLLRHRNSLQPSALHHHAHGGGARYESAPLRAVPKSAPAHARLPGGRGGRRTAPRHHARRRAARRGRGAHRRHDHGRGDSTLPGSGRGGSSPGARRASAAAGRLAGAGGGAGGPSLKEVRSMVNFKPTEEQELLRDTLQNFAREVIRPSAREADEEDRVAPELVQKGWELGLVPASIPEEHGGYGTVRSALGSAIELEELAYGDLSTTLHLVAPRLFTVPLIAAGTPEQQKAWLPRFCGEAFTVGTACLL